MKKIVLAKLTAEDAEKMITLESNVRSFKTLLENQFIEEYERKDINNILKDITHQKNQLYQDFIIKYKTPYIANNNYHISPISYELFIEVYK